MVYCSKKSAESTDKVNHYGSGARLACTGSSDGNMLPEQVVDPWRSGAWPRVGNCRTNWFTYIVGWWVFAALLILTPLYLVKIHNVKSKAQILLTTLSFPVWVYTTCLRVRTGRSVDRSRWPVGLSAVASKARRRISTADSVLYSGRMDVDYSVGDRDGEDKLSCVAM